MPLAAFFPSLAAQLVLLVVKVVGLVSSQLQLRFLLGVGQADCICFWPLAACCHFLCAINKNNREEDQNFCTGNILYDKLKWAD